jgi:hypothetical protein
MQQDTPHASYILHENGIHEFIFKDDSRRAADDVFGWTDQLNAVTPREQTIREIMNISAGLPSITYLTQRMREMKARYPQMPKLRVAFLYDSPSVLSFLAAVLALVKLGDLAVQRFHVKDRDAAVQWLLQQS